MTKLHELLAAEGRVNQDTQFIMNESQNMFSGNHSAFLGRNVAFKLLITDNLPEEVVNTIEANHSEDSYPSLSLEERLSYTMSQFANAANLAMSKEYTNCEARADLVVDDETLAKDVPATALLTLESRLKTLMPLFERMPTRDPMVPWEEVEAMPGVFRSDPEIKSVTRKAEKVEVVVPPQDKHPAQTRSFTVDEVYASRTTSKLTSLVSSARKAELIQRLSALIVACREARGRANEQEVQKSDLGQVVSDFLIR